MSLQCELSGEILTTSSDEAVVTPSGHICTKRLLLTKLTENGGMDPFQEDLPLTEDQLVTLNVSKSKIVPPRPNTTSSMPGLLGALQNEYDALVLELFDTRKALEETRRELSQALYQNDAAMRVVARVAMERDQARQQLEEWKVSGAGASSAAAGPTTTAAAEDGPSSKKRKVDDTVVDESSLPLTNDIPAQDFDAMLAAWEKMHKGRKGLLKEAAAAAPTKESVAEYKETSSEAWHASTCKGVHAMVSVGSKVVSTGKDKSVVVYDTTTKQVVHTLHSESKAATMVDMDENYIVAGTPNGKLQLWKADDGESIGIVDLSSFGSLVDIRLHPDSQHVVATSEKGTTNVIRIDGAKVVSSFVVEDEEKKYSSGFLHPDGLIFVAGTESGEILLWDFKERKMAATLKDDGEDSAVTCVQISSSGYHIGATYASGAVRVWDMRKQKCLAVLNQAGDKNDLKTATFVKFDPAGKYVAYCGKGGMRIVTIKDWDNITVALNNTKIVSGIAWEKDMLAVCSTSERKIKFYG